MGIPASPSKVSLSLPLPLPPSSLPPSLFLSWGERRAHPSGSRLQGDGKGEREREGCAEALDRFRARTRPRTRKSNLNWLL